MAGREYVALDENRQRKIARFSAIIGIMAGGALYYLFCPDVIFVRLIDGFLNIGFHVAVKSKSVLIRIIREYGFDFLWAFSFTNFLYLFSGNKRLLLFLPTIVGAATESLQWMDIAAGTADFLDVVSEMSASVFAYIILWRVGLHEKND